MDWTSIVVAVVAGSAGAITMGILAAGRNAEECAEAYKLGYVRGKTEAVLETANVPEPLELSS